MIKVITLTSKEIKELPKDAVERRLAILIMKELPVLDSTIIEMTSLNYEKNNRSIHNVTLTVTIADPDTGDDEVALTEAEENG